MTVSSNRLLIVAGHAIYDRSKTINSYFHELYPDADVDLPADCYWHGFEPDKFPGDSLRQMVDVVEQHVLFACSLVGNERQYDWIAFSGGRTRKKLHEPNDGDAARQGILNSEGLGMLRYAHDKKCIETGCHFAEECASDSFTNVFYSILGYHRETGEWPEKVGVVSMAHKSTRFFLMSLGLGFTNEQFEFHGVGTVPNLEFNAYREIENLGTLIDKSKTNLIQDPLLRHPERFESKRESRRHPLSDPREHYGGNADRDAALDLWESVDVGWDAWQKCEWPWR